MADPFPTDLSGRTALVCGASKGIGAASARALATLGCAVVGLARSEDRLAAVVEDLPGEGHGRLVADLGDKASIEAAVARLLDERGRVEILINNCGGPPGGPITAAADDEFTSALRHHLLAAVRLSRLLLPGMREVGYGRILNVISTSVKVPIPGLGVSNTTRAAVANWAKTLSREVAKDGITVNNVLPGFTDTERLRSIFRSRAEKQGKPVEEVAAAARAGVPAGRFAEAREVAAAVAFLASPAASYINGINLPVDGGRTGCL